MELNAAKIKEFARAQGLDLVGIANIERFKDAPTSMSPVSIFPEARSVIVVGQRILRGGWRGIEEGTYWPSYTYFDYHGLLNTHFIPIPLYEICCLLEDYGWEAVPYYPGPPENTPKKSPIRPGGVAPDVHLSIRIAGLAAGLGEMGWSKVFLTKEFGPRQRLHAIITDMPLEPDPLVKPRSICQMDMKCVEGCPGAIPHMREGKTVRITIEDKTYIWADVDMGKCTLIFHGGDPRVSPFLHKEFPGWEFDVTKQEMNEAAAYKFCWPMSTGTWIEHPQFPSGYIVEGHAMLQKWGVGGSYGVEGSRGCMRSCFNYLEGEGILNQTFKGGDFIRRPRWMLSHKVESKES